MTASQDRPNRRSILAAGAAAVMPAIWASRARAAQDVFVRTPGGAYDELRAELVYKPFFRETGIRVVPVASNAGKLVAMFKAGRPDIDVIETGQDILWLLQDAGALLEMPYDRFKYTDPNDIEAAYRQKFHCGLAVYADVLGFNTTAYAAGKEPKSWSQFWDTKAFPGPRGLADMSAGVPNLEFALLADGVAADKIYPIDIGRAFRSMSRIKPAIAKFWTSGALATQMLADKEVVLSTIWSSRAYMARAAKAPIAAQWNQNLVNLTSTAVTKSTRNREAALRYVDYSLSPPVQARMVKASMDIPANRKAYGTIPPELIDPATKQPMTTARGILKNSRWWADNRVKVSDQWAKWILS